MTELRGTENIHRPHPVLVGIFPHPHPEVLATAARMAVALELDLVCAYAVSGLEPSEWTATDSIDFETLDRDEQQEIGAVAVNQLRHELATALVDSPVRWSLRLLVGDPAAALEAYAVELDASMVVLGSPRPRRLGFTSTRLRTSTLAKVLSRRSVPVLVVPPELPPGKSGGSMLP